jgi:hypothetical protein
MTTMRTWATLLMNKKLALISHTIFRLEQFVGRLLENKFSHFRMEVDLFAFFADDPNRSKRLC